MAMFLDRTKTWTTHEVFLEGPHTVSNLLVKTPHRDLLPRPQRRRLAAVGNLSISHYKHASFQNAVFLFVARSNERRESYHTCAILVIFWTSVQMGVVLTGK